MIKKYFISSLALLAMSFSVSCDNTTEDPPNQNQNNSGSTTTITGPRILSKITSGNVDQEEYITNAGILSQAFLRDAGSTNTITATVTYSGNKISTIKYLDNVNPHVINNVYTLSYTAGKLSEISMDQAVLSTTNHSDFTVYYDANGQLYRIVEKKKMGGSTSYTHYVENKFTLAAGNVTKLDYTAMLMNAGNPDPSTSTTMSYAYDNYDNKINPYTTLPKEYFMVTGTLFPINFNALSSNNTGKITLLSPGAPQTSVPKSYLYDSQNYPISDPGQIVKYVYKPL
ncbi:hypothetical protein EG349_10745 [Chryseobacterium shandongense]|uniref:DUF4595 domain-containing protein n=1 Tax=Chryseobacterium shandongense TaxID=1493872 RepID=A0AAD0YEY7_9FLAO|nr:hypothetical protein [Chryseobacterium shandongense]AZA87234.1 hypothetical protein EG349_10745 [Chryseobacterium shandongense]AZA95733.1 hypothetical protein EG353_09200 [Chryseobacterium shandongense]